MAVQVALVAIVWMTTTFTTLSPVQSGRGGLVEQVRTNELLEDGPPTHHPTGQVDFCQVEESLGLHQLSATPSFLFGYVII